MLRHHRPVRRRLSRRAPATEHAGQAPAAGIARCAGIASRAGAALRGSSAPTVEGAEQQLLGAAGCLVNRSNAALNGAARVVVPGQEDRGGQGGRVAAAVTCAPDIVSDTSPKMAHLVQADLIDH